jgi:excisionase family DNA binding protein
LTGFFAFHGAAKMTGLPFSGGSTTGKQSQPPGNIMNQQTSNERLMRILQASPEQLAAIDRVLDGKVEPVRPERRGPFLLKMGEAAHLLGVSRPTLWRMLQAGRLSRVEILPGTYRVQRDQLEALAFGGSATCQISKQAKLEAGA